VPFFKIFPPLRCERKLFAKKTPPPPKYVGSEDIGHGITNHLRTVNRCASDKQLGANVRPSEVTSLLLQIFRSEDGESGKTLPRYPTKQLPPLKV